MSSVVNYTFAGGYANCNVASASAFVQTLSYPKAFQLTALSGVISVSCDILAGIDKTNWIRLGTISLAAPGADGFSVPAAYPYTMANVTVIIGGNCQVTVAT